MNTKINNKGFISIMFFLSQSMFLGVGISQILNSANEGSIYSVILGSVFGILVLLLFYRLMNYEKDLNLFKKIEKLYGIYIGKTINFFTTFLIFLYFIYTLWNVNSYTQSKYLNNTPSFIIIGLFIIPVIICSIKGIKVISKVSLNLFIFTLLIILFSFTNLTKNFDIQNLKPFFNTSIIVVIKNSIIFTSYFISPTFLLLLIPKNKIENPKSISKWIIIFYIFASICMIVLFSFIIGIFGIELSKLFYYPEFTLLKKINYFDFIEHIENILSAEWMYSLFITSTISLYFIYNYLKYINLTNNILYLLTIISIILSIFLFKNTTIGYNFIKNYFIFIFAAPILIISILSNILIIIKKKY